MALLELDELVETYKKLHSLLQQRINTQSQVEVSETTRLVPRTGPMGDRSASRVSSLSLTSSSLFQKPGWTNRDKAVALCAIATVLSAGGITSAALACFLYSTQPLRTALFLSGVAEGLTGLFTVACGANPAWRGRRDDELADIRLQERIRPLKDRWENLSNKLQNQDSKSLERLGNQKKIRLAAELWAFINTYINVKDEAQDGELKEAVEAFCLAASAARSYFEAPKKIKELYVAKSLLWKEADLIKGAAYFIRSECSEKEREDEERPLPLLLFDEVYLEDTLKLVRRVEGQIPTDLENKRFRKELGYSK